MVPLPLAFTVPLQNVGEKLLEPFTFMVPLKVPCDTDALPFSVTVPVAITPVIVVTPVNVTLPVMVLPDGNVLVPVDTLQAQNRNDGLKISMLTVSEIPVA